jgi:hypothetical protein
MRWYFLVFDVLVFCLLFQMTPAKIASADSSGHKVTVVLHSGGKTLAVRTVNYLSDEGTADTNIDFGGGKSMTSNTEVRNSYASEIDAVLTDGYVTADEIGTTEPSCTAGIQADPHSGTLTVSAKTKTDYNSASFDANILHADGINVQAIREMENGDLYHSAIEAVDTATTSTFSAHAEAVYNMPRAYVHVIGQAPTTGTVSGNVSASAPIAGTINSNFCNSFDAAGEAKKNNVGGDSDWTNAVSNPPCGEEH